VPGHGSRGIDPIPMYARLFTKAEQTRRFLITNAGSSGWEVTEEQGSQVVSRVRYTDWHRVERARQHFARLAATLEHAGWVETPLEAIVKTPGYSTNR
jgi:hypothetical protein